MSKIGYAAGLFLPSYLTRGFRKKAAKPRINSVAEFQTLESLRPVEAFYGEPVFNGNLNIVVAPVVGGKPNEQKTEAEIAGVYVRYAKVMGDVLDDLQKGHTIPFVPTLQMDLTVYRALHTTLCRIQAVKQLHNIPLDTPVISQQDVDAAKAQIEAKRIWQQPAAPAA
ncbi:MAG: hypothetical protein KGQ41_01200 [Alphaproteobacteria bacterium]|nr:hypothetical protein [Alphaproteobacteria bacterium]